MRKPGKLTWRFVQALRAVNDCIVPAFYLSRIYLVVLNPTTILSRIPSNSTYYTVVDLCSAFFRVPIDPESQFLFAFTYRDRQYTWTVLPQGYTVSPTLFSRALKDDLDDIFLSNKSTLVQYVDDLLICSTSKKACKQDTDSTNGPSRERTQSLEGQIAVLPAGGKISGTHFEGRYQTYLSRTYIRNIEAAKANYRETDEIFSQDNG